MVTSQSVSDRGPVLSRVLTASTNTYISPVLHFKTQCGPEDGPKTTLDEYHEKLIQLLEKDTPDIRGAWLFLDKIDELAGVAAGIDF